MVWHHYAGVWDQTLGTRTLYVDGELSHVVNNVPCQNMNLAAAKHLMLGARQTGGTDYDSYFSGLLYDVRIYKQMLFSDQVTTVMTTPTSVQTPEAKIRSFGTSGLPAEISGSNIVWTVPLEMDVNALAPTFTLTAGATCDRVSGATRDFSTPQTYTVTSSDTLVTTVYTVTVITGYNFNGGTLQGWHNRVWDATDGEWVDLAPNVITMPATINGGVIQPPSADNGLFITGDGDVWANGNNDNHLNTLWLRSPQFYVNGSGYLTVQLAKGITRTPTAPTSDMDVPFAAITDGGWMGVALRRASDGVFVLTKAKTQGENYIYYTQTFTQAELAPFVGVACTLEFINSDRGGWGWATMDNIVIPGSITPPTPSDPFAAWIDANYPTLSDKTPTGDPDSDGMSNHEEYAFGLNPGSGTSVNPIAVPLDSLTGKFSYTRTAGTDLTYMVWTSTNLEGWAEDLTATANQADKGTVDGVQTVEVTITDPYPAGGKLFVRVQAH